MRDTPTSTRRSDEISFVMKANPSRSRSWNSGTRSHALDAAHHLIADADVPQLAAERVPILDDDDRIHSLLLDLEPVAAMADQRLQIRRRIEVVSDAAIPLGTSHERVGLARDLAAQRHELLEHAPQSLFRRRGDPHRNRRRLVIRPADREMQYLERGIPLDDGVEDDVQELRVDQMAFGLDDFAVRVFNHRSTQDGQR